MLHLADPDRAIAEVATGVARGPWIGHVSGGTPLGAGVPLTFAAPPLFAAIVPLEFIFDLDPDDQFLLFCTRDGTVKTLFEDLGAMREAHAQLAAAFDRIDRRD